MTRLKRRPELKSGIQQIKPAADKLSLAGQREKLENDIRGLLRELEEAQRSCRDKGAAAELLGDTLTSRRWERYKIGADMVLPGLEKKKTA